ncbi:ArsR/SmtB family transcription factor [Roseivivax sediminis]|uniref:DNA-binding transcriptional regulator, ArsR family n=1 Tax=Roseivivax sediminis TaxID=936889 RepID=A0A1I1TDY8_9RHOB|nr:metalloregulator ArsR/SmtB family transcription factor [Roseivivax sediminis]SFD56799.1 DNA-binding transcriptional regulator, ArsR family [Roseivivax sediminis]
MPPPDPDNPDHGADPVAPADLAALEERAEHVAGLLTLMGNPRRLLILCRLAEGEASVSALQSAVGLSQSALSQHLARLRAAGIVRARRDGQSMHYSICDDDTRALMVALYDTFCAQGR